MTISHVLLVSIFQFLSKQGRKRIEIDVFIAVILKFMMEYRVSACKLQNNFSVIACCLQENKRVVTVENGSGAKNRNDSNFMTGAVAVNRCALIGQFTTERSGSKAATVSVIWALSLESKT